jgi:hypothetical protein
MRLPPRLLHDVRVKTIIGRMLRDIEDDPAVISDAEIERQAVREVIDAERKRQATTSSAPPSPAPAAASSSVEADAAFVRAQILADPPPPPLPVRIANTVREWTSGAAAPAAKRTPTRRPPRPARPRLGKKPIESIADLDRRPAPLLLLVGGSDARPGHNINDEFSDDPRFFDPATANWRAQNRDTRR